MSDIHQILDPQEKILWEGKPKFWPYVLGVGPFISFSLPLLFPCILSVLLFAVGILMLRLSGGENAAPFFAFSIVVFSLSILTILYNAVAWTRTQYVISSKRVILQSGIIGRDFEAIDFDQVTNVQVRVGVLDILFGNRSGTLLVSTPTPSTMMTGVYGVMPTFHALQNIPKPYEVFKFFKKVSFDVKTDIYYPNAKRPSKNPGYRTSYKAK